jgi:hypothetical protein
MEFQNILWLGFFLFLGAYIAAAAIIIGKLLGFASKDSKKNLLPMNAVWKLMVMLAFNLKWVITYLLSLFNL